MPVVTSLGTSINSLTPPTIDIRVSNGGPGVGETALITLVVNWDPAVMSFEQVVSPTARVTTTNSSCTWTDYGIPWGAFRMFRLKLLRKSGVTAETFVIATATDVHSGDSDSSSWPVPPGFPQEP